MLIAAETWLSDIEEISGVDRSVLEEEEGVIGDSLSWSIESWSTRYWDWMERSSEDKEGDEDTDDVKETGLDLGEEEELIARTASGLTIEQNALNLEVGMAEAGTSYLSRTSKRAEVGLLSIVMSSRLRVARFVVFELELEEESDERDLVRGFGDDDGD